MSGLGADFEAFQREAEVRSLGAELFRQASEMSPDAVATVSAVVMAVVRKSKGRLPLEVASEYAWQMMAESALDHYEAMNPRLPLGVVEGDT